jgi:hypothetical protein
MTFVSSLKAPRGPRPASQAGLRALARCLPILYGSWAQACLLSPPIDPTAPEIDYPPHISPDEVFPVEQVFVASTQTVTLRVLNTYDPNRRDRLYFAWWAPNIGLIQQGELERLSDTADALGAFYRYAGDARTINLCDSNLIGRRAETIWFYVSDQSFASAGQAGVEEAEGAFRTEHSWNIEINVTCPL